MTVDTTLPVQYACMPHPTLAIDALAVQAVQPCHIEHIRQWRNAQLAVLRQSAPITPEQQTEYYETHIWPTMDTSNPNNLLLTYLENGVPIGYGGLVHIAWEHRRAEVSCLLASELAGTKQECAYYFPTFLRLMKRLAFDDLGLNRLSTETYAIRTEHIAALQAEGFALEGVLKQHVIIDGSPTDSLIHGCVASE